MAALAPDISNAVVVMVNTRAMEVWKTNYFMLSDYSQVRNDLFCHNKSMWDICPNGMEYGSWVIFVGHLQHPDL